MPDIQPLILIVDDEPEVLTLYKAKLTHSGYDVILASNGMEALQALTTHTPDLILMDMKMPVMDGVVTLKKIREEHKTENVKAVFLTAFSDPSQPELYGTAIKDTAALGIMKKGGSLNELVEDVKKYIAMEVKPYAA